MFLFSNTERESWADSCSCVAWISAKTELRSAVLCRNIWMAGGLSLNGSVFSEESWATGDPSAQRKWPRHRYLLQGTIDQDERGRMIVNRFQALWLALGPAPRSHARRRKSFSKRAISWSIYGTLETKKSAELAPTTSSASRDGAILQTWVLLTLGTCSWQWCTHWQALMTMAEHSVGTG